MLAILVSAALTCAGALLVGQLVLRLCGATTWSWSAPAVGLSVLMLASFTAIHMPGRTVTTALALLALLVAGIVSAVREPSQRPPLWGLLAALPVFALALVPFVSAWRSGTLGVGFNNDMASHLAWAEAIQDAAVAKVNSIADDYPLGPHALVASLATGLGARVDVIFAGVTVAAPVLVAWTALGALRATSLVRSTALALVVGMPFFVAGYFGQGSFKEIHQALFALAVVLALTRPLPPTPLRWVPLGLLLAGSLSVYSIQGLVWPVSVVGAWLLIKLGIELRNRGSLRKAAGTARENVAPLLAGAGVTLVLLVPQMPRLWRFLDATAGTNGTGIEDTSLGNLAGRIPVWPAFGIWDNPDYRLPAIDPFVTGMWTALVLGLVLLGAAWCVRRGQWIIPVAAATFFLLWVFADRTQSPYVAAKAIVILSPLLLLLAALPVVDVDRPGGRLPHWWRLAAPVLAVVLVAKVGQSSWHALRISPVGPTAHTDELRSLRAQLMGQTVLFLGNDDFVRWELAGVRVNGPVISFQTLPTRPEKPWEYGRTLDFDSLAPEIYNDYEWVITPRDAAGSSPHTGLKLTRSTRTFDLYQRVGRVPDRRVLAEGNDPAAILRCSTKEGRAVLRTGGRALVREPSMGVELQPFAPGSKSTGVLPLTPGTWDLAMPYGSPRPLEVQVGGRRFTMPAALDRPGPRLPLGTITVGRTEALAVKVTQRKNALTPRSHIAYPGGVIATRRGSQSLVSVRAACGRAVDWYIPSQ